MVKICPECKTSWPSIYKGCPYCVVELREGKYSKEKAKGVGLPFKIVKPSETPKTEHEKVPDEHYSKGKRCIEPNCGIPITNTSMRCRKCAGRLLYSEGEEERRRNQMRKGSEL